LPETVDARERCLGDLDGGNSASLDEFRDSGQRLIAQESSFMGVDLLHGKAQCGLSVADGVVPHLRHILVECGDLGSNSSVAPFE